MALSIAHPMVDEEPMPVWIAMQRQYVKMLSASSPRLGAEPATWLAHGISLRWRPDRIPRGSCSTATGAGLRLEATCLSTLAIPSSARALRSRVWLGARTPKALTNLAILELARRRRRVERLLIEVEVDAASLKVLDCPQ
jgi:hypothetical protein